ncbi:hypothetical protein GCM10010266_50070 [Streptomyces griseomycini]|nr:hypothetical protein GCM10010266_50070 [Streptomyces griseomycini]
MRVSVPSRIRRTTAAGELSGSATERSGWRRPGAAGQASPHSVVTTVPAALTTASDGGSGNAPAGSAPASAGTRAVYGSIRAPGRVPAAGGP